MRANACVPLFMRSLLIEQVTCHFNEQAAIFFVLVNGNGVVADRVLRAVLYDKCPDVLQIVQIQKDISLGGGFRQQRPAIKRFQKSPTGNGGTYPQRNLFSR